MEEQRLRRASVWRLVILATVAGCDAGALLGKCDYSPRFTISGGDAGIQTTSAYVAISRQPQQALNDESVSSAADTQARPTSSTTDPGYSVIYRDYGPPPAASGGAPPQSSSLPPPADAGEPAEASGETPQYSAAPPVTDLVLLPFLGVNSEPSESRPVAPRPPLNGGTVYYPTPPRPAR
jgi:hypothetical protein